VISASFAASNGIRVFSWHSQAVLDTFHILTYISKRWSIRNPG